MDRKHYEDVDQEILDHEFDDEECDIEFSIKLKEGEIIEEDGFITVVPDLTKGK